MVVGGRDGHHAGGAHVPDGAGGHDAALTDHQPGQRGGRAQGSGIGQGDRRARVVVGTEASVPGAGHQLLVAGMERGELHVLCSLDDRHHQEAATVRPLDVHRQPEVDGPRIDDVGFAPDVRERSRHARLLPGGAGDRVPDQVGEADLARRDELVQLASSRLEDLGRDVPERRGGGNRERGRHVGRQPGGGPAERGGARRRLLGLLRGGRRLRWADRFKPPQPGVEQAPPLGLDAGRIGSVLLVDRCDVARVQPFEGVVERLVDRGAAVAVVGGHAVRIEAAAVAGGVYRSATIPNGSRHHDRSHLARSDPRRAVR